MKYFHLAKPLLITVVLLLSCNGCMTFRSEMDGTFNGAPSTDTARAPVTVLFHFSHLEFAKGFDVVPKIIPPRRGFRDIFGESMKQITNIKSFATFTDADNDIDDVARRHKRDSLRSNNDFTIHVTFKKENSFAKHFLANLLFYGSLSVAPVGFSWDYSINADVTNSSGKPLNSYARRFSLSSWNNMLLVFAYPFYPSEMKIEEIYLQSLQDIFRQIESEYVLKPY
jgi:hypothetical protein